MWNCEKGWDISVLSDIITITTNSLLLLLLLLLPLLLLSLLLLLIILYYLYYNYYDKNQFKSHIITMTIITLCSVTSHSVLDGHRKLFGTRETDV